MPRPRYLGSTTTSYKASAQRADVIKTIRGHVTVNWEYPVRMSCQRIGREPLRMSSRTRALPVHCPPIRLSCELARVLPHICRESGQETKPRIFANLRELRELSVFAVS